MIGLSNYPAVRTGHHSNPLVRDVESHLSLASYNYFRGDTDTTTIHECSHGINADLRNKFYPGKRENCFYLLNDEYAHFPEPNWRKREVIPYIPDEYRRGTLYSTYVSGSNWDDRPLYLWDEWTAYVNGAMTGASYSITNAITFGYYAGAVLKKEHSFGLRDFFDFVLFRLYGVAPAEQWPKLEALQTWMG